MAGFDNEVLNCVNYDFRGVSPIVAQVTTAGQLPIGTGGTPAIEIGSLTSPDASIIIGYSSPNITLKGAGFSFPWVDVTLTSALMVANSGYGANNAAQVDLKLPVAAAVGSIIQVTGVDAGGWIVTQNGGQTIHFISQDTTTGVGGSLASTVRYDTVTLRCVISGSDWVVESSSGNITVV